MTNTASTRLRIKKCPSSVMKLATICTLLLVLVISIALAIPAPLRAAYPQHVRQNSQSKVEAVEKVDAQRGDYYYYYETPTYYYYETPTYYYYETPTYYYYETPTYYYYETPTYYYYESPTYYYYETPEYYYRQQQPQVNVEQVEASS